MAAASRRHAGLFLLLGGLAATVLLLLWQFGDAIGHLQLSPARHSAPSADDDSTTHFGHQGSFVRNDGGGHDVDETFIWRTITTHHPVTSFHALPTATAAPKALPKVQRAHFPPESDAAAAQRLQRRDAVKATFLRCWNSYRDHAWLADEVSPLTGQKKDVFGGWGATLVDALDTMWIMGLSEDFGHAVTAVDEHIDFSTTRGEGKVNVFETNIRYLGGLLSAYDLSGDERLLRKAHDVGDMLYKAFDTPNRMPIPRWDLHAAAKGEKQEASSRMLLAELGSFAMEFTRLSLLTGEAKYFDAIQRITELLAAQQEGTAVPGLWPVYLNTQSLDFTKGTYFTLNGEADSTYEYLIKMVALVGGTVPVYADMYAKVVEAATRHAYFRPMTPQGHDILLSGFVNAVKDGAQTKAEVDARTEHLGCFTGGMMALGGRLLNNESQVETGMKLTMGCVWSYAKSPSGIMPEAFALAPCPPPSEDGTSNTTCPWSQSHWHAHVLLNANAYTSTNAYPASLLLGPHKLPPGFVSVTDPRYILRPEAIESVFVLYRITGDENLRNVAWDMWMAIDRATKTQFGSSSLLDVMEDGGAASGEKDGSSGSDGWTKMDSMESFWFAETLKYFYLIFSEPDLISLDEWVFNTEAHPFRRLVPGS